MARSNEAICSLVKVRTLELENKMEAYTHPWYKGLCVSGEIIIVVDCMECNVQLYRRFDGKFLATSCKLESPHDIFLINDKEIGVILVNSKIEILSVSCAGNTGVIKKVRTLVVNTGFVVCHAAVKFLDKLVVSGEKQDTVCWCIASLVDGYVESIHQICKGYGMSYLTFKENTIYISCQAGPFSPHTGLYAYDNSNPRIPKYLYRHSELKLPSGITVDTQGFIFMCNENPPSIHHLTDRCELVAIYSMGMPSRLDAIFWDQYHEELYVTSYESNLVTQYKLEYLHQQGVPTEILNMDDRSIQLFKEALKDGKETVYSKRVMVVGHMGVGKTTLVKRLLGEEVNISERHSTEGIDIFVNRCDVSLSTHEWLHRRTDAEQDYRLQRLARVLNEQKSVWNKVSNKAEVSILSEGEKTDNIASVTDKQHVVVPCQGDNSNEIYYCHPPQLQQPPSVKLTQMEMNTMTMLKLLKENASKLKQDIGKSAPFTIWDFAGEYAFYTTHQTFMTRRAIYLLVSDISEQLTDLVADECYFDSEGIMRCKVHGLVEPSTKYLKCSPGNRIKTMTSETVPITVTHAASATIKEQSIATTIFGSVQKFFNPKKTRGIGEKTLTSNMTGAHVIPAVDQFKTQTNWRFGQQMTEKERVDEDTEKRYRHEICERYFRAVRSYLRDKPTRFHLVDEDFAIDNTVVDRKLEDLKRKIVEVASQQPYWGEEIPARWLLLEQELMRRKAAGIKVISLKDVERINKEGTVQIERTAELDLFLRYLHETGTIIYFSIEVLRDNIVLDPVFLIDALKSLINAQSIYIHSLSSASSVDITQKWSDFKEKGILTSELIDVVWRKEKYPELHANRYHILLLMEQLNIIARPRSFNEIGEKVEDYFLAPCMLRQESPREVITPEHDPRFVSTSVLGFVFTEKFLPPPIFHRLLAACVARWPVAKKKETSESLIFCGCCVFDLDLFHRLTLHFRNHIVFARITRMVIDEVKTPDAKMCSRVRKFLSLNLSKITSYLGQNLQYEMRVQHQPSEIIDDEGFISCSPILVWFSDEEHDPDAPIMPEHMNHARLCVALVTVCGNAMRDVLLTHFPIPYRDIYQAILANKTRLTSRTKTIRGQWQNGVLNQNQSQVVFPYPLGQYVATVDQFDIPLLYTLIRNISSVPAPLMGWGIDPPDHPRDTSVGASVERIRSYRNHIVGHSMDGKISQQDFQDYWNKIDYVLHDIESVVGRQGYRSQLEKQKRQVISLYEAY